MKDDKLLKLALVLSVIAVLLSMWHSSTAKADYDGVDVHYDSPEKFNNMVMREWIRSTGAGMVLQEAMKVFQREYFELGREFQHMFERVHRREVERREREEERRNEGEHGGSSGGFLDNINNDARGGVGV